MSKAAPGAETSGDVSRRRAAARVHQDDETLNPLIIELKAPESRPEVVVQHTGEGEADSSSLLDSLD